MKNKINVFVVCLGILLSGPAFADILCPLKPDPPPAIDGNLAEWYPSAGAIELTEKNVTYGKEKWTGEKDLSGILWFYWDVKNLYVAAEVIDDVFMQQESGRSMWLGDHVELDVDIKWTKEAEGFFTNEQFMIGLSPGNLLATGDPLFDMPPEFTIWHPTTVKDVKIRVAAQRTEKGYNLEAAIPWKTFGMEKASRGTVIGVDLRLSDTDNPRSQDTMTSLNPKKWERRNRAWLLPLKLGDSQGK